MHSSQIKERTHKPVVPSMETKRLQNIPLYFLIRFETSFAITLDTQVFRSKKNLICVKSFTNQQKVMSSIEKLIYLQPIRWNRPCDLILTSTEIFI